MDYNLNKLLKEALPLLMALAICLLVLALATLLTLGREIFVPLALAILLSFVLAPAVRGLQRLRAPHGLAVAAVVLIAFAAMSALGTLVAWQLSGLAGDLPKYQSTISQKIEAMRVSEAAPSTLSRAAEAASTIARQIEAQFGGAPEAGRGPTPVVVRESGGLLSRAGGVLGPLLHPLATAGVVLLFTVFVLAQREDLRNRLIKLVGTEDLQHTTAVIDDAASRLSRFFVAQLLLNAAFGLVIGIGLWLIGVPSPVLWGVLAGVLRFVPYVGAVIGAVFPAALAFAVDPGWSMLAWTVALFLVVEPVCGHVLEPVLYGHASGLSPLAVILAAALWTFLWGPVGLVIATPLTVCLVVLGRHVEALGFLDVMLGDRPALSPAEIFYQRMLAGDPTEAVIQAREFLRERALATYYDEVALEGLRLAQSDIARGRITPERQVTLRRSVGELMQALDAVRDPRPQGGMIGAEAQAAVTAAGPDTAAATRVVAPHELRSDWRSPAPVLCVAAHETLDAVVAGMCAQVLVKHGLPARVVAMQDLASLDPALSNGVRLTCLSFVEPLSTLHLRYATRSMRRTFKGVTIVLGIWRQRDPEMRAALRQAARADALATTVCATLADALHAAGIEVMPTRALRAPGRATARLAPAQA